MLLCIRQRIHQLKSFPVTRLRLHALKSPSSSSSPFHAPPYLLLLSTPLPGWPLHIPTHRDRPNLLPTHTCLCPLTCLGHCVAHPISLRPWGTSLTSPRPPLPPSAHREATTQAPNHLPIGLTTHMKRYQMKLAPPRLFPFSPHPAQSLLICPPSTHTTINININIASKKQPTKRPRWTLPAPKLFRQAQCQLR